MSKKIWFTADAHYGDNRLHLFPRPFTSMEEMEATIILNHNRLVQPNDTVYFLGDVALTEDKLKLFDLMAGRKYLIKGNYDTFSNEVYRRYFEGVSESLKMVLPSNTYSKPDIYVNLVHYPSKGESDYFNLVGHIHGAWRIQKNMLNVGLDAWNYRPVSVDDIGFMWTAINQVYDEDVWAAYHKCNMNHMKRGKEGSCAKGTA